MYKTSVYVLGGGESYIGLHDLQHRHLHENTRLLVLQCDKICKFQTFQKYGHALARFTITLELTKQLSCEK